MFYQRRIVKKLIGAHEDFKDTWKLVMKKADIEMTKELARAVKYFLSKHPGVCDHCEDCRHRTQPFSPLHIGAEAGQTSLCEFILKITEDKNPSLISFDIGWTPLHEAAQEGHLLICYMIMNEITDKNPGDIYGITPLHGAAAKGQLETFKLIMDKVTDINPRDNEGWTPLHEAARRGYKELCEFITNNVEDKNPEDDRGWTPKDLMWNKICGSDV
jgi:ankyrin repeat protein